MIYSKQFTVQAEHIDFHGIMDGLYYAFYFERCRHNYVAEVVGFDLRARAEAGLNMVLTLATIKYKRPVLRGEELVVTCSVHPDSAKKPLIHFVQEMLRDGKSVAEGHFTATCVSTTAAGWPHIPDDVAAVVAQFPPSTAATTPPRPA